MIRQRQQPVGSSNPSHPSRLTPDSWSSMPDSWHEESSSDVRVDGNQEGWISRMGSAPMRWIGLIAIGALGAAVLGLVLLGNALGIFGASSPAPVEVAVYFPGTSDTAWLNWIEGVRLAANEQDLTTECTPSRNECLVKTRPVPILFRWYPTVGSRQMQLEVSRRCQQSPRPIAVVGSSNSSLTQALAEALQSVTPVSSAPVLLMTDSTADDLISIYRNRSFRFGFNNSYQAHTVVDRLKDYYGQSSKESKSAKAKPKALVVKVADSPFAVDLAYHFERELIDVLNVEFQSPEKVRSTADLEAAPLQPKHAWTLSTATGRFSTPSPEERSLATQWARALVSEPDRPWIMVLPVDTSAYRRLSTALADALRAHPDADRARRVAANIVVLSGDALSYHSFDEPKRTQLQLRDRLKAPVIFFAHVNPDDPTVTNSPCRMKSSRALDREVARALLTAIPTLGTDPTAAGLIKALVDYQLRGESKKFFADHERVVGGGAIVARPKHDANKFELVVPEKWRRASAQGPTPCDEKAIHAPNVADQIAAR